MPFSNRLWKLAAPIWNAQLTYPSALTLGEGTLPERKGTYYLVAARAKRFKAPRSRG